MAASVLEQAPLAAPQGSTLPRVWTQPDVTGPAGPCGCGCALTEDTSLGFVVADFAAEIGRPLDPWQRWLVIHAMERQPDGLPRFRQVVVVVARQNGKTELLVVLTLFWMFAQLVPLILGTSTKLDYARESWAKAIKLAKTSILVEELPATKTRGVRSANGEQEFTNVHGSRYKIAASNEEGGRSLTVHRLVEDELRQHRDWSAHEAAENAMNAVADAQAWGISNAGDARSVVLNSLLDSGLKFIETGHGDRRLGVFVWSAAPGSKPTDPAALAQANPSLGLVRVDGSRGIMLDNLLGKAMRAEEKGGEQLAKFLTENMCITVSNVKPLPIDVDTWAGRRLNRRARPAGVPTFGLSVAPNLRSAAISAAVMASKRTAHLELADHRSGTDWLVARCEQLAARNPDARFVAVSTGAVAGVLPDLIKAGIDVQLVGATDLARAYGHLEKRVKDKSLTHTGAQGYTDSLTGAVKRDVGEGLWSLGWKSTTTDLAPIESGAIAVWSLSTVQDTYEVWGFVQ